MLSRMSDEHTVYIENPAVLQADLPTDGEIERIKKSMANDIMYDEYDFQTGQGEYDDGRPV